MKKLVAIVCCAIAACLCASSAITRKPRALTRADEKRAAEQLAIWALTGEKLRSGFTDPRSDFFFHDAKRAFVAFLDLRDVPCIPNAVGLELTVVTFGELKELCSKTDYVDCVFVIIEPNPEKNFDVTILRSNGGDSYEFGVKKVSQDLQYTGQVRWSIRGSPALDLACKLHGKYSEQKRAPKSRVGCFDF